MKRALVALSLAALALCACTPPSESCIKTTCAEQGKSCGQIDDGCGGSLECGASCPEDATCTDGAMNQDETDVDCGGRCSKKCLFGKGCAGWDDCTSGRCEVGKCAEPDACRNNLKDGLETDADCGGTQCLACAVGKYCREHTDCLSATCVYGVCKEPSCTDGMKNQGEVDVDCAGPCSTKCADGKVCGGPADCASGACAGGRCISCQDEAKNGSEADVDCGGACSTKCGNGKSCGGPADCQSGMCENQRCVATGCSDGVKNGSETDTDCGGGCPTKCTEGKRCTLPGDCQSGLCPGGTCVACLVDGVKDGQETDVDCGASCPSQCADGKVCGALADCSSGGICLNDRCQRHCGVGNGGCDADALCTNTPSGRTCVCRAGYLGDGMGCMDIDECQTGNGGCNDANAPVCVNEPGGYRCIADLEWANWSVPPETPSSYTVGVETVTDNVTGLIWQKDVVSLSFNWGDAKTYCSVISLGGQGGWRLPTLIELLSIVNSGRSDPAINTSAFPNTPSEHFWSSTPYSGSLGGAWRVYFNGGGTTFNNLSSMGRVRCVR